jgi:DNA polymerase III epsilon subunit-like protein
LPVPSKTLCTVRLSRKLCRLKSYRLESVAQALGVSGEGYHRALADAVTTARVLMELLPML